MTTVRKQPPANARNNALLLTTIVAVATACASSQAPETETPHTTSPEASSEATVTLAEATATEPQTTTVDAQTTIHSPPAHGKRAPCVFGQDQTCNGDPAVSALWGKCTEHGTCECNPGFTLAPTGYCQPSSN